MNLSVLFAVLFLHGMHLPALCWEAFSVSLPLTAHNSVFLPHLLLFFFLFSHSVNSLHCHRSVYLPNTNLSPLPLFPLSLQSFSPSLPLQRWDCVSECAGDLERGSIRNLKINALSARKSMGLIGMPIGPVKTIKREEKCLTTSSLLLT